MARVEIKTIAHVQFKYVEEEKINKNYYECNWNYYEQRDPQGRPNVHI